MVYIDIIQDGTLIILNCHRGCEDGEFFQLVIDAETKQLVKRPAEPDMDASIAYAHVYGLLKSGELLPEKTVAAWG